MQNTSHVLSHFIPTITWVANYCYMYILQIKVSKLVSNRLELKPWSVWPQGLFPLLCADCKLSRMTMATIIVTSGRSVGFGVQTDVVSTHSSVSWLVKVTLSLNVLNYEVGTLIVSATKVTIRIKWKRPREGALVVPTTRKMLGRH